ncbi:flagellar biosynthetic protein FliO [Desulfopila sp. IMCC35008]|uniref:FliO/MopB family protein n=1 Tax=Desulfopila sp. IMCC35008 TaxID=2653858 RepID=UPI0013D0AFDD|nr:flagellar biosynthetic protein FliO [Desulfopila sp. IMCC35008]
MKSSRLTTYIFITVLCLTVTSSLGAEGGATGSEAVDELAPYFRMLWGLCIVLGVMLVLYGLFKKRFNILAGRSGDIIRIKEIKPVMPKKSLCLVEVRGKEYLLGIGNESITLLANIDDPKKGSFQDVLEQSESYIP